MSGLQKNCKATHVLYLYSFIVDFFLKESMPNEQLVSVKVSTTPIFICSLLINTKSDGSKHANGESNSSFGFVMLDPLCTQSPASPAVVFSNLQNIREG